ncbi:hypothetical protein Fcan01_11863 [Folsomia candida]|uniref:Uncharacterized protein n=1 Tax=Folsomia candida TaxID=158441 RepID=A0A226ECK2_FOLCA|nr:hypothetical protein Fcan01_11863 [Folsomia candida]
MATFNSVVMIILFPVTTALSSHPTPYISDLVADESRWNLQILHCGLESALYLPSQDYNLPTTIYQISLGDITWIEHRNMSIAFLPASKGRTSLRTFMLLYFDAYLKFTTHSHHNLYVFWLAVNQNKFLQFLWSLEDFLFNEYSFVVFVTSITKSELRRHQNGFDRSNLHDFVIAYRDGNNTFEICVMPQGMPIQFSMMKCNYKRDQSLVRIVVDHTTPPLLWHLGSIQGGDLIQQDLKDNQLIAPMSKALNPFEGTQSIHQYLIHISFHHANANIIYLFYDPVEYDYTPHLNLHAIAQDSSRSVIVATESLSYNFITCYMENYISFELYLKPFQPNLWATLVTSTYMDILMEYALIAKQWKIRMAERGRPPARILQLTSLLNPLHSLEAKDLDSGITTNLDTRYAIEKEVSICGKAVFIARTNTLDLELDYLRKIYYTIKFYKSEDSILDITLGWKFDRPGNSKIPHYFKSLLESGIHSRLVEEQNDKEYRKRRTTLRAVHQRVSPMALTGSTLTFILNVYTSGHQEPVFKVVLTKW